mmetsp:Transcript_106269/g.328068  ORF Transcript_106269/g.328068 Transcript_106269/m.328068 type:complete len:475 (-) Transcript_106269:287-1711(-)
MHPLRRDHRRGRPGARMPSVRLLRVRLLRRRLLRGGAAGGRRGAAGGRAGPPLQHAPPGAELPRRDRRPGGGLPAVHRAVCGPRRRAPHPAPLEPLPRARPRRRRRPAQARRRRRGVRGRRAASGICQDNGPVDVRRRRGLRGPADPAQAHHAAGALRVARGAALGGLVGREEAAGCGAARGGLRPAPEAPAGQRGGPSPALRAAGPRPLGLVAAGGAVRRARALGGHRGGGGAGRGGRGAPDGGPRPWRRREWAPRRDGGGCCRPSAGASGGSGLAAGAAEGGVPAPLPPLGQDVLREGARPCLPGDGRRHEPAHLRGPLRLLRQPPRHDDAPGAPGRVPAGELHPALQGHAVLHVRRAHDADRSYADVLLPPLAGGGPARLPHRPRPGRRAAGERPRCGLLRERGPGLDRLCVAAQVEETPQSGGPAAHDEHDGPGHLLLLSSGRPDPGWPTLAPPALRHYLLPGFGRHLRL